MHPHLVSCRKNTFSYLFYDSALKIPHNFFVVFALFWVEDPIDSLTIKVAGQSGKKGFSRSIFLDETSAPAIHAYI